MPIAQVLAEEASQQVNEFFLMSDASNARHRPLSTLPEVQCTGAIGSVRLTYDLALRTLRTQVSASEV